LGGINSAAYAINASGQVTGYAETTTDHPTPQHAFLSAPNGGALTDIGTLGGGSSVGWGVNDSGQVTGAASLGDGTSGSHAFLSGPNGGALKDLGTLGGTYSVGYAVNASGQVAGHSPTQPSNIPGHAFLSAPNGGTLKDLGTFGGSFSSGMGINDQGDVVGESYPSGDTIAHAFLYTSANGMRDLNSMIKPGTGFTLSYATSINNLGQIAVYGTNSAGQVHAFLLNPYYLESFNMGIKESTLAGNTYTAKIQAFAGHTYQLQRSTSLDPATANWQDVGSSYVATSDQLLSLKDTNATGTAMFYRVKLTP
jgi:probable HAF family extracellular repeat protein